MMQNVIPIRRPDSEVTEIAIGAYTVRRRVFSEGGSYLTFLDDAGATLFVSKDVLDVALPIMIAAYAAGRGRGRADMLEPHDEGLRTLRRLPPRLEPDRRRRLADRC